MAAELPFFGSALFDEIEETVKRVLNQKSSNLWKSKKASLIYKMDTPGPNKKLHESLLLTWVIISSLPVFCPFLWALVSSFERIFFCPPPTTQRTLYYWPTTTGQWFPSTSPLPPLRPVYHHTVSRTIELSLQSSFQSSVTVLVCYRSQGHI